MADAILANFRNVGGGTSGTKGRKLSGWDCTTGLPSPDIESHTYESSDYYTVTAVGTTNYKPNGTQYVKGTASTTTDATAVSVGGIYIYDGTSWAYQASVDFAATFHDIAGEPADNPMLFKALSGKIDDLGKEAVSGGAYNLPYYFYINPLSGKIEAHAMTISLDGNRTLGDHSLDVPLAVTAGTTEEPNGRAGLYSKSLADVKQDVHLTDDTAKKGGLVVTTSDGNITASEIKFPTTVEKDRFLHTNASTGAFEYKEIGTTLNGATNKSLTPSFYATTDAGGTGKFVGWDTANSKPVWKSIAAVLHFKGKVSDVTELATKTATATVGDVWFVTAGTGGNTNYAFDGESTGTPAKWSDIGNTMDMSDYLVKYTKKSEKMLMTDNTTNGEIKVYEDTLGSTKQFVYISSGKPTLGISIESGTTDPTGTPAGGVGSIYIKYSA